MPLWVSYVARNTADGYPPPLELELDGKLVESDTVDLYRGVDSPLLAIENEDWAVLKQGEATWGRVEFVPDDDSDNCLFWRLVNGVFQIRAFGTMIQLDLFHINQPDSPSSSGEGGVK